VPESTAPYLYYRTEYPGLSLSIISGGGSSDIAVFKNASNSPEFISSVKFAGMQFSVMASLTGHLPIRRIITVLLKYTGTG